MKISITLFVSILVLTFGLFTGTIATAQTGSIKGQIKNRENKTPIPEVLLEFVQDSNVVELTLTDELGYYHTKQLPAGIYKLTIRKPGFEPQLYDNVVVQANQSGRFFFDLKPGEEENNVKVHYKEAQASEDGIGENPNHQDFYQSLGMSVELSEFTVVEYSVPLISRDNVSAGGRIYKEDIARMPGRSVSMNAATVGGVYSRDDGANPILQQNQNLQLHVRGARSDANAYFIDGIRVHSIDQLPQQSIETIQVYTGGIPAQYGDVTGGVINVTTKSHPTQTYYPGMNQPSTSSQNQNQQYNYNQVYLPEKKEVVQPEFNTESYEVIYENEFQDPKDKPLSTFSIDVDQASYTNVRRYINGTGVLPPQGAVRVEEMINYFEYDYPKATSAEDPIALSAEVGPCPWNEKNQLLKVAMKGYEIPTDQMPASNLVFLLDVSGSMQSPNKLGLVKRAMKLLTANLSEKDVVSIITYAGNAGVVLPPTRGHRKDRIIEALNQLTAGGSTNGVGGIKEAYALAQRNFMKKGNNRIILATDGDFNVGVSSNSALLTLIEEKRQTGVFLTTLGFGMGNYKDDKMELLADKGNGNYYYIDNFKEASRIFSYGINGWQFAVAKDVKLQLEFNPNKVKGYRLIGYENRLLADKDFNDDLKDAGEIGSGHTVTALYELIPAGVEASELGSVDPLKYQTLVETPQAASDELLQLKCRYKLLDQDTSKLKTQIVKAQVQELSPDFQFAACVAAYGMILRDSDYTKELDLDQVISWARKSTIDKTDDKRIEFISLMKTTRSLRMIASKQK